MAKAISHQFKHLLQSSLHDFHEYIVQNNMLEKLNLCVRIQNMAITICVVVIMLLLFSMYDFILSLC